MEPDPKEGDQVLVSTLNCNNLKGPNKMRDSFVGPFTIIELIGENSVEVRTSSPPEIRLPPPDIVEVEESPGPVKKIIKARKIRLNGTDKRQLLVRFKTQIADKDKCVTTITIHPLGTQYGISMPYPIYGYLAISIIIGPIGHFIFFGLLWSFHHLGPAWPLHHDQAFPEQFCFWEVFGIF
ncbi:hypothetical protein O181_028722 [Austropuccinia psidii MF-1]|uniref:Uncharacterized protein n=1 Tax=Austropuccinia psidii MF-1 TaxID=1389203 RepID=A0A9Q3CSH0_9BASI|nr:hypothetical protein [Austropuccinia psidii MF-1]